MRVQSNSEKEILEKKKAWIGPKVIMLLHIIIIFFYCIFVVLLFCWWRSKLMYNYLNADMTTEIIESALIFRVFFFLTKTNLCYSVDWHIWFIIGFSVLISTFCFTHLLFSLLLVLVALLYIYKLINYSKISSTKGRVLVVIIEVPAWNSVLTMKYWGHIKMSTSVPLRYILPEV